MEEQGLHVFRDPRSVAVVGASAKPAKWGNWLARGALAGRRRRAVYLVNGNAVVIDGTPSFRTLRDLPEVPDLVVLCVPASRFASVVDEALELGVRGFVGITAGLDQVTGVDGAERDLAARIRKQGARLLGPNCLGLYDADADLQLAWGTFTPGALGIVSQSGQLGSELAELAAEAGVGVSRFVSLGNQVDVTAIEALDDLVDHERTRVVGLYLESFSDGRELTATLHRLRRHGKRTLLLTVGTSEAGRSAARSHTGALTSPIDVVDAACRAAGALRVETPAQLVDVAQMLLAAAPVKGRRLAIVGDSGGQGAVAADVATRHGLEVAPLAPAVAARLLAELPVGATVSNPIDLAGTGEQDLASYARVAETLTEDDAVDCILMTGYFGSYSQHTAELADQEGAVAGRIGALAAHHGRPIVVHSIARSSSTIAALRAMDVPTYHMVESAARALAAAAHLEAHRPRPLVDVAPRRVTVTPGYWGARALLVGAGVPYADALLVRNLEDLLTATAQLEPPYVLKADWLQHKSEVDGVVVGLADRAAVVAAYETLKARLGPGAYVLEQMDTRRHVVEVLVGARYDPSFGATVLVGAGGTEVELHRDTALELAPVDPDTARQMLRRLRSYPLLDGWRGRPPVDVDALADVIAAVSRIIAEHPELDAVEVNPVRVGPGGVLAVDALLKPDEPPLPAPAPSGIDDAFAPIP